MNPLIRFSRAIRPAVGGFTGRAITTPDGRFITTPDGRYIVTG